MSELAPFLIRKFGGLDDPRESVQAYEAAPVAGKDKETLEYVVNKDYEDIQYFEPDDALTQREGKGHLDAGRPVLDRENPHIPYFLVKAHGISYGTEEMGLGEASAHAIIWGLRRAAPNSILLIEEPETFLSPQAQEALLNVIADYAGRRGITTIVTTHSEAILRRVPVKYIRLVTKAFAEADISEPTSRTVFLQQIGIPDQKRAVIFVEDKCARAMAQALIRYYDPDLLAEVEVRQLKDASGVRGALEFPKTGDWLTVTALLDGNERLSATEHEWKYSYLPSTDPPDTLVRSSVVADHEAFAMRLGIDEERLRIAMSKAQGRNDHDWLEEVSRESGAEYSSFIAVALELWLDNPANELATYMDWLNLLDALLVPRPAA